MSPSGSSSSMIPEGVRAVPAMAEQFLAALRYLAMPVSFEVVGTGEAITLVVSSRAADKARFDRPSKPHSPTRS